MTVERQGNTTDSISQVRLNARYRAVVHKELPIQRQDVPAEIQPGRLDIERKRDGKVIGSLPIDLTGMFEVTEIDRKQWRSQGQKFLQERVKPSR